MGADYYAKAVIGVRIDTKHMRAVVRDRACCCKVQVDHEDVNFCPKCGVKYYKEDSDELRDEFREACFRGTYKGYELYFDTDHECAYLGIGCRSDSSRGAQMQYIPGDLTSTMTELMTIARQIDPELSFDQFGLWVINYCSY